ncbi:baseplate J/gp47 family protein [Frankia nepalensis]|uniref:Baseplate protein J-like domain-containing protein n=1 Tax=Frankia nepalensis TaxID=1836974 RepID=A0A937RCD7_9ACTN|nr:hypothetical protein [Frankia nepalensis]MBL7494831.1 hypothetical protein [Frankia nepalensis]MBL7508980.1 hypothetical protein [Frankia nepalensis]MBL7626314.1 hypothetical protein [Frankia nepalensis]
MSITPTGPDELTYAALMAEARALIPALHPGWTDHNPSDPGIALVELFAWLTEILAFQVDEVPDAHTWSFLALLNGPAWRPPPDPAAADLGDAVAAALRELERRHRAVTAADYEHLLRAEWPGSPEAAGLGDARLARLARVHAVARRDLTRPAATAERDAPAHVSVIVVPPPAHAEARPAPSEKLLRAVAAFLDARRLVTTRLRVVGPAYAEIGIAARLGLRADAPPAQALADTVAALRAAFDMFTGGPEDIGRPFGEPVHLSDVYAVLDALPLVDFAEDVTLTGGRPVTAEDDSVSAIGLAPHELAVLRRIELVAHDSYRRPHALTWTAQDTG